jgi:two-component system, OmpR family, sensor histidine kinase ChvG
MTIAQRGPVAKRRASRKGEVLLGEDWIAPDALADEEFRAVRSRRNVVALNRSPLARKIVIFNAIALLVMIAGIMYLSPYRDGLVNQRASSLQSETRYLAALAGARITAAGLGDDAAVPPEVLEGISNFSQATAFLFDAEGTLVVSLPPRDSARALGASAPDELFVTGALTRLWETISSVLQVGSAKEPTPDTAFLARVAFERLRNGQVQPISGRDGNGFSHFSSAAPIEVDGVVLGAVAMVETGYVVEALVSIEREQMLQVFLIALLVSIGLSLLLAATITNPLADLAAAAELGRDRDSRKLAHGRVRIPDLTARPDEIGRLSVAMRGMVAALYDRIDANEQFAADVAHEIKNPLASLRSAVGTMRVARREDQREKLLEVIEHDVRRLDRLVSDISNASRLDSELVKEEEDEFDLLKTVASLAEYLGKEAKEKGVDLITDFTKETVKIRGLEGRLAQVFVNLITNAISFCHAGDAVRVWARRRGNRVLIVVEDTGPGIPEEALTKVFKRFYSERPEVQFGNHSGLGLAISKQIVEAHGGVIWAENIRVADADVTSPPLGARFVVGLPV